MLYRIEKNMKTLYLQNYAITWVCYDFNKQTVIICYMLWLFHIEWFLHYITRETSNVKPKTHIND